MTTDFDTVKGALKSVGLYDNHPDFHKNIDKGIEAASRIEASHAALVAQRDALFTAMEAIISSPFGKHGGMLVARAEAAVALSKGGAK